MRYRELTAALLLGVTVLALGPVACKMDGSGVTASTGTALGIVPGSMDRSIKPGDDFYGFANGTWMRTTEIPEDRSSVGGFFVATQKTEQQLGELIAAISQSDAGAETDEGRIRDFYNAYLDTAAIDAAGMAPIQPELERIARISDIKGLSRTIGETLRTDVDPLNSTNFHTENLFGLFVTQALAGGEVMPYVLQGGLGLPEREYYLSSDPKMAELRGKYRAYIAQLLGEAGIPEPAARAERIFELETKIAKAHASREVSEDFQSAATQWTRAEFAAKAPGIDWDAMFAAAQLSAQQKFSAYHAGAIPRLSALVANEPIEAWKDWLLFHQINKNTDVLPTKLDRAAFAFYGTAMNGTAAQRPREKRALDAVNAWLGDALGKLYVEKYFSAAAKTEVQAMVSNIKQAFATRVEALDWLAPSTKKEAIEKVRTIEVGVGYPDSWQDYSALKLTPGSAYASKQAASRIAYAQQLAKLGKKLDKREWWMNAQLVNAVNLPVQNALNFPAAILQRPFFDASADPAYNYGSIGAVIGHEISHSFDNNGAAFDATGKMRNWWTAKDLQQFNLTGQALAEQYDAYKPFPDLAVNGKLTLGENIADVAGLAAAYDAYRASLKGKEAPVINGFTGDQRFFIAYAQAWASKFREPALRARIATDGHAPGMYRALTVRNLDAWYKAFDVKPGDKLYLAPEARVKVW